MKNNTQNQEPEQNGIIDNCEISGNIALELNASGTGETIYSGLFAARNYGEINNCKVNVSANLTNSFSSDAYFGLVSGTNEKNVRINKER